MSQPIAIASGRSKLAPGLTLVEVLVVIVIIAVLVSLLVPSLNAARDAANVALCISHLRQVFTGFRTYATDHREYPTNYTYDMPYSWNWGDECAGRMFGNPPGQVTWVYGQPPYFIPNQSLDFPGWPTWARGAGHRLLAGEYLPDVLPAGQSPYTAPVQPWPSGVFYCTGNLPAGWVWAGRSNGVYVYNGPHSYKKTIGNNSAKSGLWRMGRHHQGQEWGVRMRRNVGPFTPEDVAFMGCPSMYETNIKYLREPHGFQSAEYYGDTGYGNGQSDWGFVGANPDRFHYDRNYLFGDGHVRYVHSTSRGGLPE